MVRLYRGAMRVPRLRVLRNSVVASGGFSIMSWIQECVKKTRVTAAELEAIYEQLDEPERELLANLKATLQMWDLRHEHEENS